MSTQADQLKALRIKTGTVQRLVKEVAYYEKQVVKEEQKAAQLAADATNEDEEYVAKKSKDIVKETANMVRDSQSRLQKAVADLRESIASGNYPEEAAEFVNAKTLVDSISA
ncbi:Tubulin-specific chaperone A [Caenorhabditis elegans]|uniref:Tubulin-specific chaperone A n=1 Tax=Caenorhabditis elegans TaxID=6239 RepID=Q95XR1_CAEEL|nr:Tubulin-specific chaperone A [Caenorhabditis elegans]CCD69918.1 Tubulin-specific chaperone A [Caenorhabditis elegans]|eukprot:NP_490959.1 Tubulin-specific chaperone A [Caenorhabditis elegans]